MRHLAAATRMQQGASLHVASSWRISWQQGRLTGAMAHLGLEADGAGGAAGAGEGQLLGRLHAVGAGIVPGARNKWGSGALRLSSGSVGKLQWHL